jgi:hypothetical protein
MAWRNVRIQGLSAALGLKSGFLGGWVSIEGKRYQAWPGRQPGFGRAN